MRKLILLLGISLLAACGGGDDESSTPPPIALAGSVSLDEDSSVTITLSGNPQSGGTLSYSISTQPSNGSLSGSGNSWTYTPNADFSGSDAIRFTVSEGGVRSTPATIEITVNPINDVPVAGDLRFELDEDSTVTANFDATDVDDDALNFSIISGPKNGSIDIGNNGQFTFTPNQDYSGSDSATIAVSDNIADAVRFLVSFDIAAINDQPTVPASTDLILLSGMTEFIALESEDVDGDSLTLELFSQPDFVGYERNSLEIMVSIAQGDSPSGTFSYRVKDAALASDLGEINYTTDNRTVSFDHQGANSEPANHRGVVSVDESFIIATEVTSPSTETHIQLFTPEAAFPIGYDMLTFISRGLPAGASAQSVRGIKVINRQMKTLISYDSNEIQIITADISSGAAPTFQNLETHLFPLATDAIYTQLSFDFHSNTAFVFERNKLTGYQSSSNIFESTLDFGSFDSITNVRILDSREYAGNIEWLINVVGARDGSGNDGSIGTYIVRINSDFSSAPIEISTVELPFDSSTQFVNGTFTRDSGITLTSGDSLALFSESLSPLWTTTVSTNAESMVVAPVDNEIWMLSVNQSAPDVSSRLYLNRFDYTGEQISSREFATDKATVGEIRFGQPIVDEFGNVLLSFINRESSTVEEIIVFVDFEGNPKLKEELSASDAALSDAGLNSGLNRYTRIGNDLILVSGYTPGTSLLSVKEINRQGY